MPVQFLQGEISAREQFNSLAGLKDRSVDPGFGQDIGGNETLWGDGSITGSNSNGLYTKWPNGDLECSGTIFGIDVDTARGSIFYGIGTVVYPHAFISAVNMGYSVIGNASTLFGSASGAGSLTGITISLHGGSVLTNRNAYWLVIGKWK